jgi:hypothetical protein
MRTPIRQAKLGAQDSDLKPSASKTAALPVELPPIKNPRQVPPLASRSYKDRPVVGPGVRYVRPDSNRHGPRGPPAPQAGVYPVPPRTRAAARGSNRAVRRTKTVPQAVRGGVAGHPGLEPGSSASRARRVCRIPLMAIEYGGRDSNAQAARFELARSSRLPSLPRAPPGIRTPLCGLRVRSITTMLAAPENIR